MQIIYKNVADLNYNEFYRYITGNIIPEEEIELLKIGAANRANAQRQQEEKSEKNKVKTFITAMRDEGQQRIDEAEERIIKKRDKYKTTIAKLQHKISEFEHIDKIGITAVRKRLGLIKENEEKTSSVIEDANELMDDISKFKGSVDQQNEKLLVEKQKDKLKEKIKTLENEIKTFNLNKQLLKSNYTDELNEQIKQDENKFTKSYENKMIAIKKVLNKIKYDSTYNGSTLKNIKYLLKTTLSDSDKKKYEEQQIIFTDLNLVRKQLEMLAKVLGKKLIYYTPPLPKPIKTRGSGPGTRGAGKGTRGAGKGTRGAGKGTRGAGKGTRVSGPVTIEARQVTRVSGPVTIEARKVTRGAIPVTRGLKRINIKIK